MAEVQSANHRLVLIRMNLGAKSIFGGSVAQIDSIV
jgi:hypothetical protein